MSTCGHERPRRRDAFRRRSRCSARYVFTNAIEEGPEALGAYDRIRSLAARRGSPFLAVMLDGDIDVEVSRVDNADRRALRKGSDPEGYRGYRLHTRLYQPPAADVLHLDTTTVPGLRQR